MNGDYEQLLKTAARLRLKATSLLAESEQPSFEAAVLFHEAERALRGARNCLDSHDKNSLLRIDIERAWCLLDAGDPVGASQIVPQAAITSSAAKSLLTRLRRRLERAVRDHASDLQSAPTIAAAAAVKRVVPTNDADVVRARQEVESLATKYPGTLGYWWVRYRLADALGQRADAWESLQRAERLRPDRANVVRAIMLSIAPTTLAADEAQVFVETIGRALDEQPVEVLLQYALVQMRLDLSRTSPALANALRATHMIESQTQENIWSRYARVVRRMLDARAQGVSLSLDVLVEEGLGHLVKGHQSLAVPPPNELIDLLSRVARADAESRMAA